MPERTISILGATASILAAAYMALMGATVYFAAITNDYSATSRELETEVAALETEYYAALSRISSADAELLGYAAPRSVEYVAKGGEPALTRADR